MNTENCFNTQWGSDGDSDYVVDFCERKIAEAFAPELKWAYTYDDVRGEAYWVAGNNGLDGIRVGYLLGYYRDLGSSTFSCSIPPISSLCNPHNGDSEAVFIDATYNLTTKHWVLSHAWYYQHGTPHGFQPHPSKGYATGLEYPAGSGDYPRVWVAEDKHASYATQSSCNSGGAAGSDTCVHNNSSFRVFISSAYNIGSRSDPNLDCVTSRDPSYEYYGGGRTECYWTDKDFRGWVPDSIGGGHANAYTDVLDDMGF